MRTPVYSGIIILKKAGKLCVGACSVMPHSALDSWHEPISNGAQGSESPLIEQIRNDTGICLLDVTGKCMLLPDWTLKPLTVDVLAGRGGHGGGEGRGHSRGTCGRCVRAFNES